MFHRSPSDEEYIDHRRMVEEVVESLADSEISMIAKRGVTILSTLLEKEQSDRARELDIPQLIHSFCEQEHRDPDRHHYAGGGGSLRPGWPPSGSDQQREGYNNNNNSNNSRLDPGWSGLPTGLSRVSTPVGSAASSSSYYRHAADELFPELSHSGGFTSTSHSWEDVMLLAQNYVL